MSWDPQNIKDQLLLLAGIMVVVAAIVIIAVGRNGEIRKAAAIGGCIFIAAVVIAVGSHLEEVGDWAFGTVFS